MKKKIRYLTALIFSEMFKWLVYLMAQGDDIINHCPYVSQTGFRDIGMSGKE